MSKSSGPIPASEVPVEAPEESVDELTEEERLKQLHEFGVSDGPADVKMIPLRLLTHAKVNPRRGAVAEVIESLQEFGQHRPMVVQFSNGQVIVGNHLLKALRALGADEGACLLVDDDDMKGLRRALADNAVGDKAGWDEEELAQVLGTTGAVPGYGQGEVDKLLEKLAPPEKTDEPTYPLVPRLNEKYDYVMIFCTNETDWNWLQTRLELRREKSYKSEAVATSHVLTVERFQELLGEK